MFAPIHHTIPKRCQLVYDALAGRLGQTSYTRQTGRWRYIDLIQVTGRNSSDKKLRELRDACPGLVAEEPIPGSEARGGDRPKQFWLASSSKSTTAAPIRPGTDGRLFDMEPLGRPGL